MEIRNLTTFLRVAALRNFTQASRELGYSQSNVSTQISQLEQEVGAPLFNRIGKTVTLTQYGEELLPYANQIVSTAQKMESFLKSNEALGGVVKIGIVESIFDLLPEELFIRFQQKFPCVKLELIVDGTETLKEFLRRGVIDAACLIDYPLEDTEWQLFYSIDVPIVIIGNPMHPLAKTGIREWKELEREKFIFMEDSAPYSILFKQILARNHVTVHPFLKLQSTDFACRLVERGAYLSILPLYAAYLAEKAGTVRILETPGEWMMQSVQIVLHRGKVIVPQLQGWMEGMKDVLRDAISISKKELGLKKPEKK